MRERVIRAIQKRADRSILILECGHDRSIGGHMFQNGKPVGQVAVGDMYECHDGNCGRT